MFEFLTNGSSVKSHASGLGGPCRHRGGTLGGRWAHRPGDGARWTDGAVQPVRQRWCRRSRAFCGFARDARPAVARHRGRLQVPAVLPLPASLRRSARISSAPWPRRTSAPCIAWSRQAPPRSFASRGRASRRPRRATRRAGACRSSWPRAWSTVQSAMRRLLRQHRGRPGSCRTRDLVTAAGNRVPAALRGRDDGDLQGWPPAALPDRRRLRRGQPARRRRSRQGQVSRQRRAVPRRRCSRTRSRRPSRRSTAIPLLVWAGCWPRRALDSHYGAKS